jgi:hypothetical protein
MNRATLIKHIFEKQSYLCIGLDPDLNLLPGSLGNGDPCYGDNNYSIYYNGFVIVSSLLLILLEYT